MILQIKQLLAGFVPPERGSEHAAGYDLRASAAHTIAGGETKLVSTGFAMALPAGHVGLVCSRSGLAVKHSVFVLNAPGIVDEDYRGDVGVILHNAGRDKFHIAKGDRVAQLLIIPYTSPAIKLVSDLPETQRGSGGFGSTGVQ